jgi:hypothetical protein
VPHDVTVSYERYTIGFQFVTGAQAMSLQLAAASCIYIHYALQKEEKQQWRWQTQLYASRYMYKGSSILEDLNFQSVSGLYKNVTRMSYSDFLSF